MGDFETVGRIEEHYNHMKEGVDSMVLEGVFGIVLYERSHVIETASIGKLRRKNLSFLKLFVTFRLPFVQTHLKRTPNLHPKDKPRLHNMKEGDPLCNF